MADNGNSERKEIAELYFKYDKALEGLKKIDEQLSKISEHSLNVCKDLKRNK